jgi:cell shape-determining protein MreC
MVGSEYDQCPMCGADDGQGCFADCPSQRVQELETEVKVLQSALESERDTSRYLAKRTIKVAEQRNVLQEENKRLREENEQLRRSTGGQA